MFTYSIFMTDSWLLTLEVVYIKWHEYCEYWIQKDAEETVIFWFEADAQCLFFFLDFNQTWIYSIRFQKALKY
jgi:hypothetical protein